MKCQKCQQETFLPFKCPYCGNYYCAEHRLPENHQCQQIELARTPKQETTQPITFQTQTQKPYEEYTVTYIPTQPPKTKIHFSKTETKHLTIAALLVTGIALSIGIFPYQTINDSASLTIFTLILTTSFFTHEIAHKITAQKHNLWAEFRLTFTGAILTLISIISPLFKIISPGAVFISGITSTKNIGKISIAGPTTNILLSIILLTTAPIIPQYYTILIFGAAINTWIALFNLIPFGILDGFKIFLWNKKIWTTTFAISLTLTIISYKLLFDTL